MKSLSTFHRLVQPRSQLFSFRYSAQFSRSFHDSQISFVTIFPTIVLVIFFHLILFLIILPYTHVYHWSVLQKLNLLQYIHAGVQRQDITPSHHYPFHNQLHPCTVDLCCISIQFPNQHFHFYTNHSDNKKKHLTFKNMLFN